MPLRARSGMMDFVQGLKCVFCGTIHGPRVGFTCPRCGIEGILDVQYDYLAIGKVLSRRVLSRRAEQSHWRYRELLPVRADSAVPALSVGWTPLTPAPALARHLGLAVLYLKDDG